MRLSTVRRSVSLLAASGALLSASSLLAQSECEADADCDSGFVCEVTAVSGCAAPAPCAEGEDCAAMDPIACEAEEYRSCVPGPCQSDADCGAGMVCEQYESGGCNMAAPACDPDGNCEDVKPVDCESVTSSQCVYQWQTSCEVDADCGEGFTCTEGPAACACGGSTGMAEVPAAEPAQPNVDGGAAAEAPPMDLPLPADPIAPDCVCEASGVRYCAANEVECTTDADCPSLWTCESAPASTCGGGSDGAMGGSSDPGVALPDLPTSAPLAPPEAADAGAAEAVDIDEDVDSTAAEEEDATAADPALLPPEEMIPQDCEPVAAKSMCVPPGGYYGGTPTPGGVDPNTGGEVTSGEGGGDDTGTVVPGVDLPEAPAEPPSGEPQTDDDEAAEETAADEASSDTTDEATDDEEGSQNNAVDDDAGSNDDGGCAVHAPASNSSAAAWLLGMLGLTLLRRRRA